MHRCIMIFIYNGLYRWWYKDRRSFNYCSTNTRSYYSWARYTSLYLPILSYTPLTYINIFSKEHTGYNFSEQIPYMRRNDSRCLHGDYMDDSYPTRMDAESICDLMQHQFRNCTTIYDRACDGDNYRICKEGAEIATSPEGSCIYSNIGNINFGLSK